MLQSTFKPVTYYDSEARRYLTRFEPCVKYIPDTDEQESSDPEICSSCNGSGEGMYDGTRCMSCGGSGVEHEEYEEDDRRDYEREDKE